MMEESRRMIRRKRAYLWAGATGAVIVGAGALVFAGVPHAFTSGETLTADNLNTSFAAVTVVAASATATGVVAPNLPAWTPIPGMTVTFTLGAASLVQMSSSGVQRTTDTNAGTECHTGYRYVVDGTGRGDATYGQRIQVSFGNTNWHQGWSLTDAVMLDPGSHTIVVQAYHPSPNGACYICGEADGTVAGYDSCAMNVIAVPQ
jgi:hypothetical protein